MPAAPPADPRLATPEGRQFLVTAVLRLVHGTYLEPQAYERSLLDQFVRGDLTLEEVATRLDTPQPASERRVLVA